VAVFKTYRLPFTTKNYLFIKNTIITVKITFAKAKGKRNFQPKFINWSNLKRGKVPRTQIYKNKNAKILNKNAKWLTSA
jgi:hypothetical protein